MNYFNQTEVLNQVLILPQIYIYIQINRRTRKSYNDIIANKNIYKININNNNNICESV